jgi:hypothetical protein
VTVSCSPFSSPAAAAAFWSVDAALCTAFYTSAALVSSDSGQLLCASRARLLPIHICPLALPGRPLVLSNHQTHTHTPRSKKRKNPTPSTQHQLVVAWSKGKTHASVLNKIDACCSVDYPPLVPGSLCSAVMERGAATDSRPSCSLPRIGAGH